MRLSAVRQTGIFLFLFWCALLACSCHFEFCDREGIPYSFVSVRYSACFGVCPVYEITIDRNGIVQYVGKQFVSVQGRRHDTLTREENRSFWKQFHSYALWRYPDQWQWSPPVSDVQEVQIIIAKPDTVKTFVLRVFEIPADFAHVLRLIDSTARVQRWIKGK